MAADSRDRDASRKTRTFAALRVVDSAGNLVRRFDNRSRSIRWKCSTHQTSLAADERAVWLKLRPIAFQNRTLTKATAYAFEMLSAMPWWLERPLGSNIAERVASNHRGMIQRSAHAVIAVQSVPLRQTAIRIGARTVPVNPAQPVSES